jgi:hypothetical protein
MATITINFDLIVLYMVAANVVAILSYVLIWKEKARRAALNTARATAAILDYFQHSEIEVNVECISRLEGKRFVAIIESQPLKRFRYSHIVEINLCSHVERTCGLILEKVYWRFPIDLSAEALMATQNPDDGLSIEAPDEYINGRMLLQKAKNEYSVMPATWKQFEEAVNALDGELAQATREE